MSETRKSGRNIKLNVTEDISHMGIFEEKYRLVEDSVDPELNRDGELFTINTDDILRRLDEKTEIRTFRRVLFLILEQKFSSVPEDVKAAVYNLEDANKLEDIIVNISGFTSLVEVKHHLKIIE